MPELDFKGKEFVRNHHLTVPFRPLVPVPEKGIGDPDLTGNLIIHGDNLEALKALLPMYAGKVDCIFIDPPYNTGNEGWSYNDNVNSPVIKAWFTENPVGVDDALRHDKWCCMMWPRLKLLRELLAEDGIMLIAIDDHEYSRLVALCEEVFGDAGRHETLIWKSRQIVDSRNQSNVSSDHEYIFLISKGQLLLEGEEINEEKYSNPDDDHRGPWMSNSILGLADAKSRPNLHYKIVDPRTGNEYDCPADSGWRYSMKSMAQKVSEGRIVFPKGSDGRPREKKFRSELNRLVTGVSTVLPERVGFTLHGSRELRGIFQSKAFDFPKPSSLVEYLVSQACPRADGIVLDSFAGSGTTAHAVEKANAADGGNRKFILVEMEDYADTLTAERVRRVINGYPYQGTQRETLYEKKLTWTEIRKGDALKQEALDTKAMHEADYDDIETVVKDGVLKVVGVRNVKEMAPGLGGTFTYCELGRPIELDKLLSGGALPEREAVADYIIYLAGLDKNKLEQHTVPGDVKEYYLGTAEGTHIWLLYRPDRKYLSSADSALTLETARAIHASDKEGRHRVYSPAKYVGTKILRQENIEIEHVPLPLALFRGHTE